MELIKIEHLGISFDSRTKKKEKVKILQDINLSIEEGEVIALVGESGCGKTTLGKTIVGLYPPSEGTIYYRGKEH